MTLERLRHRGAECGEAIDAGALWWFTRSYRIRRFFTPLWLRRVRTIRRGPCPEPSTGPEDALSFQQGETDPAVRCEEFSL